ncbi:hypothetical protein EMCG_09239 [[Emmonsia] crescens]|uniref:Uncharacterized protein n=1 Tax=[Emmonsia] crescens TaxID=73230 RepID=A0A0G2I2L4_9EURO|nr:hypothetical protein EMCG_09239 [Emmonsia crescens UAMH 3008]
MAKKTARLVQTMSTIPAELVHQILDDLTIYNILLLASHDNLSLNDRIYSFLVYRKLIERLSDFLTLKKYFKIYSEIHTLLALQKCPSTSPLALGLSTQLPLLASLNQYMHHGIFIRLRVSDPFISLLKPFTQKEINTSTYHTTIPGLEGYWQAVIDAQGRLNSTKSAQLRRIADILETYPDFVYQASDIRKAPVANVGHVVRRFRIEAEKTSRANVLRTNKYSVKGLPSAWLFWPNLVPIVPLDMTLELFFNGMQEYPPSPDELASASNLPWVDNEIESGLRLFQLYSGKDVTPGFPRLPPTSTSTSAKATHPYHRYAKPILQDICTTIKGFMYVYMPPAVRGISAIVKVRRTQCTPSASAVEPCISGGLLLLKTYQDSIDTSTISRLKAVKGTPHDEREFEWLEALLRCCRYLEQLGVKV